MIFGAIGGFLAAVVYTLVTGKLQLTKSRVVYDAPARRIALIASIPLFLSVVYILTAGRQIVGTSLALVLPFGAMLVGVALMYAIGWSKGEPPR